MFLLKFLKNLKLNFKLKVLSKTFVGSLVGWLKRRGYDKHDLGSKPTRAIPLCPWEDISQHFPLLSGLGKQSLIKVISLLNYKRQKNLGIFGNRSG